MLENAHDVDRARRGRGHGSLYLSVIRENVEQPVDELGDCIGGRG